MTPRATKAGTTALTRTRVGTKTPIHTNGSSGICPECGQHVQVGKPRPGHETVEIVSVTPEMASEWLDLNVHNRKLRESRVASFVGTLERSQWTLTGDSIVFDEHGHLINGQHRLKSIVESGVPVRLLVLRGVPTEAQEVMDGNLPRQLADALKLRGYTDTFVLASSLTFLYKYRYIEATGNVNYADPGDRPTVRQCLALLESNPELADLRKRMQPVYVATKMRKGMGIALWHVFAQIDKADADEFFLQVATGTKPGGTGRVGLVSTHPVFQLRRYLFNELVSTKGRSPDYREAALTCRAWNIWREGREVGNLTWHYGGRQKDQFPLAR